jgi:hypothetical protein
VLARLHDLAAARQVLFTLKATQELTLLPMGLDVADACDILANLAAEDSVGRFVSGATGEWMYVFKTDVAGVRVYIKLILRGVCVVVSFHEDQVSCHEQETWKQDPGNAPRPRSA